MSAERGERRPGRDGFLDVVRAVALVRVVTWHAFGLPVLTYLVAAVPAMFFVTGTLYARSLDRHGARATVGDRFRRLLPPLWLFAAVAWAAMAVAAAAQGTDLPLRRALLWVLPVADPSGTAWEGGWLSSPLWYLRVLVWLLALGPVVVAALRRWPRASLVVGAAALVGLEVLERVGWHPDAAPRLAWQAGDLVLYGLFFAVGVRAHDGALDGLRPARALAVAAVAAGAATLWWATQPVPLGVANNSHPLHLLVGVVWLALALAARPWLAGLARHRLGGPVVAFLGRRSLSVYLWHSAAIAVVLWALSTRPPLPEPFETLGYACLVALATMAVVAATGWAEDLAAGRPARWWPLRARARGGPPARALAPALALGVAALALGVVLAPHALVGPGPGGLEQAAARRPPVPSQAPPLPSFEPVDLVGGGSGAALPSTRPASLDAPVLEPALGAWMAQHEVAGAVVGIAEPGGASWVGAVGVDDAGEHLLGDRPVDTMSVTKLFTANLVYRAADAGLIDLDAPVPPLEAVPEFPYASLVTPRQLLSHRSGMVNYRDTDRYQADPASVATPADALAAVAEAPLVDDPGTTGRYSSTNYLVLGYLLEQVTGRAYHELLADELLAPLGLDSTEHLASEPSEPRFSTAGVRAPLGDLLTAGVGLLRDHVGISDAAYEALMDVNPDDGMSAGALSYCPCQVDPTGSAQYFAVGYAGGSLWLAYLPDYDLVAAVEVTGGLSDDGRLEQVVDLVHTLADQVRAEPGEAGGAPDPDGAVVG